MVITKRRKMPSLKRPLAFLASAVVLVGSFVGYFSYNSVVSAAANKVGICHAEGKTGVFHLITVSTNAQAAHLAHGDGLPGGAVPGVMGKKFTALCAQVSTAESVYANLPTILPGNIPSIGFEATSTSEFGGQIALTGTARKTPTITVYMSSWGCENGTWNAGNCTTTTGATFNHPVTINVYGVGSGDSVGSLIETDTKTFDIPFRPSADTTHCTDGKWYDGTNCYSGKLVPITFNLSETLPGKVIVSVSYDTTHYGYNPIGQAAACFGESGGCGYDALNVAATSFLPAASYPLPDGVYLNSSWGGAYGDNGSGGTGTFRLDPSGWTGYQPVISVSAEL